MHPLTSTLSRRVRQLGAACLASLSLSAWALSAAPVYVYGPGGPAPAMKEAAQAFERQHGHMVIVTAGPTPAWVEQAKQNADVVFSGAEHMMSDFARALPGQFELREAEPLYLRPVAILVRPGNPKGIQGFRDLLKPGVRVLAVAGAGQTGLWEDVAGRTGEIEVVRAFRRNLILPEAPNSAAARQMWTEQPEIDAWLIWNIWQVANAKLADQVAVEPAFRIHRDTGVVLTTKGKQYDTARQFVDFLKSPDGQRIFAKWGWQTGASQP